MMRAQLGRLGHRDRLAGVGIISCASMPDPVPVAVGRPGSRDLSAGRGSATAGIIPPQSAMDGGDGNSGLDDLADDDAVIAHRARAKAGPGQMARQAKQALADAGIDLSLFFLWIALDAVRGHVQLSTQLMISSRSTDDRSAVGRGEGRFRLSSHPILVRTRHRPSELA